VGEFRPPIQERLRPRGPSIYSEIEAAYEGLSRTSFMEWVLAAYPWRVWGPMTEERMEMLRRRLAEQPGPARQILGFGFMSRATGDPEPLTRAQARAIGEGYGAAWAKAKKFTVDEAREAILKATDDGRPRTFNRLLLECCNITADMAPMPFEQALAELLLENRLAWVEEISPQHPKAPSSKPLVSVALIWNDRRLKSPLRKKQIGQRVRLEQF